MTYFLLTGLPRVNRWRGTEREKNALIINKEYKMNTDLIEGAADAATFTGLSRRKIYRLVEQGHMPSVRKGRRLYFRKSELDAAFSGGRAA
jgi:excisionase family DNA binding protein